MEFDNITILKYNIDDLINYQNFIDFGGKTVPILINHLNELLTVKEFKNELIQKKLTLRFDESF